MSQSVRGRIGRGRLVRVAWTSPNSWRCCPCFKVVGDRAVGGRQLVRYRGLTIHRFRASDDASPTVPEHQPWDDPTRSAPEHDGTPDCRPVAAGADAAEPRTVGARQGGLEVAAGGLQAEAGGSTVQGPAATGDRTGGHGTPRAVGRSPTPRTTARGRDGPPRRGHGTGAATDRWWAGRRNPTDWRAATNDGPLSTDACRDRGAGQSPCCDRSRSRGNQLPSGADRREGGRYEYPGRPRRADCEDGRGGPPTCPGTRGHVSDDGQPSADPTARTTRP